MFAQKVLEAGGPFPSTSVARNIRENGHQGQCSVADLVLRIQTPDRWPFTASGNKDPKLQASAVGSFPALASGSVDAKIHLS